MNKRILSGILAAMMLGSSVVVVAAEVNDNKKIEVTTRETIALEKFNPIENKGATLIPVRELSETLGYKVEWKESEKGVELSKGPNYTSIKIGVNSYFYARMAPVELSSEPILHGGATYVPFEFFEEILREDVKLVNGNVVINGGKVDKPNVKQEQSEGAITSIFYTDRGASIRVIANKKSSQNDIVLHIDEDTKLVNVSNKAIKPEDLKVGNKVVVELPEIMTMSLPPQGYASYVKVLDNRELVKKGDGTQYPQIKGLVNGKMEEKINKDIEEFAKNLHPDVKFDYDVKYFDDNILSIVYFGEMNAVNNPAIVSGGASKFVSVAYNIDLRTGERITYENYFKKDDASKAALEKVFDKAAKEQYEVPFEAEGRTIYFGTESVIVMYYPLDDSVEYPNELWIPLSEVKGLVEVK